MKITGASFDIDREEYLRPYAFKGSQNTGKWNVITELTDASGVKATGIGGIAVLWADSAVFFKHTEAGGNILAIATYEHALQAAMNKNFENPCSILNEVYEDTYKYACRITESKNLRHAFVLNSLVSLDNAAWALHYKLKKLLSFDEFIPESCRGYLNNKQTRVAFVPIVASNTPDSEIKDFLDSGCFVLKLKLGNPGSTSEMLEKDIEIFDRVAKVAEVYKSDMTDCGEIVYYLDINGRYTCKNDLHRLLDYIDRKGLLDRVIIVEEPFDESLDIIVDEFPINIAADESLHDADSVRLRHQMGYRTAAIKPAGKTMSMAFETIATAGELGMDCFVADNSCVPMLVEWNKNIAARLPAFPGIKCSLMESNGSQMYKSWDRLINAHPCAGAGWIVPNNGVFNLDSKYYRKSGGIFD